MSSNHNGPDDTETQGDFANKRAALAGQWRTPPMPVYPTGYSLPGPAPAPSSHGPSSEPLPDLPAPTNIPSNSEDYAKALQEAYRKGAEAAARLAQQQQQQQHIPTAASCPNFSTGHPTAPPPLMTGESMEEAAYSHQVHPTPTSHSIPDPLATSSMPPPPPPQQGQHPHLHHSQPQPQPPAVHQQLGPPAVAHHSYAPPHSEYSSPVPAPHTTTAVKPPQGRSLSMPDMSTYAAQAEEEKRQKRLARNRASARLRRLRKKNLVDAYETEVGILEKTLKQLKAHEWGRDDNHKALLDALGMERGQQAIPPDQRATIIRDILNHQMQQVQLLRQAQLEQECLAFMVAEENADDEMVRELQEILQLSEEQKQELQTSSQGLDKEVEALETIAASLQAMQENDWLVNEGVQTITDQFTSIMHKNQLSKFLLWTDANVEAIDQLDHVQVQPLQGAPLFMFGVESTPVDDDDGRP